MMPLWLHLTVDQWLMVPLICLIPTVINLVWFDNTLQTTLSVEGAK